MLDFDTTLADHRSSLPVTWHGGQTENLWGKRWGLKLSMEPSVLIVAMFCSKCSYICPHTPCRLACWCFTLFFSSRRVTSFITLKIMSALWWESGSFKIRWKHSPYCCQPACVFSFAHHWHALKASHTQALFNKPYEERHMQTTRRCLTSRN